MLFSLFIKALLSFLGIYILGSILFKIFIIQSYRSFARIFFKFAFGLISSITFFAICNTSGITIMTGMLLVSLFLLQQNKWRLNTDFSIHSDDIYDIKRLVYIVPLLIVFFSWRWYTIFQIGIDIPIVINMDSLKHVLRAGFLVQTGIESVNVNYINPPQGVDAYHYFEAWAVGLFGSVLGLNFWIAQQIVVYPLISTSIVVGFWGLLQRWKTPWYVYIVSICIVMHSGLYSDALQKIPFFTYTGSFMINAFDEWKGFVVAFAYIFILLFCNVLFSENSNKVSALYILLFLPIISITLAPGILAITTSLLFLLFLFRKKFSVNINAYNIAPPFVIAIYIYAFYSLFEPTQSFIEKPNAIDGLLRLTEYATLRTMIIISIENIIHFVVLYLPSLYIAFLVFFRKRFQIASILRNPTYSIVAYIIGIGYIISLGFWIIFYESFGSSQFLFYTILPFINIFSLLLCMYAIIQSNNVVTKIVVISIVLCMGIFYVVRTHSIYENGKQAYFDKYSHEYIKSVVAELQKIEKPYGLKLESPDDFIKFNDNHHLVGNFLPGNFNNSNLVSITLGEMYIHQNFPSKEAEMLLPKAPVAVFVQCLKDKNEFVSFEDAVCTLIENYGYMFVFVSPHVAIPNYILEKTNKILVDEKSGEKLILLEL
ncbi:MAG: hypothetical protein ACOCWG_00470 [bacterium]